MSPSVLAKLPSAVDMTSFLENAVSKTANKIGSTFRSSEMSPGIPAEIRDRLEDVEEICNTFHPIAFSGFVQAIPDGTGAASPEPDGMQTLVAFAGATRSILSDISCTSVYSSNGRATFWDKLAADFPGIIDFCVSMDGRERTVFFGVLCKLRSWVDAADGAEPAKRRIHDLVMRQDESSLLFHLCSCTLPEFRVARKFLEQFRDHAVTHVPAGVLGRAFYPPKFKRDGASHASAQAIGPKR